MGETSLDFLQLADECFRHGELPQAISHAIRFLDSHKNNYWAEFLLARIHRKRGDTELTEFHLRRAMRTLDPARIGAYFFLSLDQFSQEVFTETHLIDEALVMAEHTEQSKWYRSRLLFLRALRDLRQGRQQSANLFLKSAYEHQKTIDESEFAFPWVIDSLKTASPNQSYLFYLFKRYNPGPVIDYDAELKKLGPETFVLEIGAMDGVRFDTLYKHITERRWQAVMLEPTALMFAELKKNYRDFPNVKCMKVAISDRNAVLPIYRVDPERIGKGNIGDWAFGVSALDSKVLGHLRDEAIEEQIEAVTFDALVESAQLNRIDVLQIDTEGHDYIIFKQIDLRKFNIKIIHIEIYNLDPVDRLDIFQILSSNGYRFYCDRVNLTAVKEELA